MNKAIITLAITSLMAGTTLMSCQSSSQKVENAQEKVLDAKEDVQVAKEDLTQALNDSINQFRKESEDRFLAHEKSISEFKARIAKEKKQNRVAYEKKLTEIESKNTDLRKQLNDYKEEGKDNWEAFKSKFKNNMEDLGTSIKNFNSKH